MAMIKAYLYNCLAPIRYLFGLIGLEDRKIFHRTIIDSSDNIGHFEALDCFEKIYVIHLESNTARRDHIREEFKRVGIPRYELFPAVESSTERVLEYALSQNVCKYPPCFRCGQRYCRCENNVLIRRQIANWLSFLDVFSDAVNNRYALSMVCEDDVKFTEKGPGIIADLLNSEFLGNGQVNHDEPLLIRMGHPGYNREIHDSKACPHFSNEIVMSNSCFAFNFHYAAYVLESLRTIEHTSDVYFHRQIVESNVQHLTMVPPPCFDLSQSKKMYSDIHPKGIDQRDAERGRLHVKKITDKVGYSHVFGGNFGDLIGPYLFRAVTAIEPVSVPINDLSVRDAIDYPHYLIVGSTLKHVTEESRIWGIGIMNDEDAGLIAQKINHRNVLAVRGPLTLRRLCPELDADTVAIGDPALLLPLFYRPTVARKYKYGIIPHCTEYDVVQAEYVDDDVLVIKLSELDDYRNIEVVIDQILSCDRVLSSSLHGIIVAHAYSVPAAWHNFTEITASGKMGTSHAKFKDYFDSVKMAHPEPSLGLLSVSEIHCCAFTLADEHEMDDIRENLLSVCPFNLYSLTVSETSHLRGSLLAETMSN